MRYKVDLIKYTAECDANYLYLLRLFPNMAKIDSKIIALGEVKLVIKVKERMPYTTDLQITQIPKDRAAQWVGAMIMKVRVYHDLNTAEVCEFGHCKSPAPKNSYPNTQMHHRDEKIQWNRFLREWLTCVLEHGYSAKALEDSTSKLPFAFGA